MGEIDEGAGEGAVREGGVDTEDWEGNGFRGDLSGYMKIGYIMFTSCHKLQTRRQIRLSLPLDSAPRWKKAPQSLPRPCVPCLQNLGTSFVQAHHGCCPSKLQNRLDGIW